MIKRFKSYLQESNPVISILYWCLMAMLIFLITLFPALEEVHYVAIVSASLAIVIVSLITYWSSLERTDLLKEQNNIIESQLSKLEAANIKSSKQTDILQELSMDVNKVIEENETDDDGEHKEAEESTEG